jgi:mono/diheme cytochrome c family protein
MIKTSAAIVGVVLTCGLAAVTGGSSGVVLAQQQQEAFAGITLFKTYCAMCHGVGGKGDGSLSASLRKRPPDLTQLTKRNDGAFPADKVTKTVDGRELGPEHARGDMPVWGDAFSRTQENSDAESVRRKIEAIVQYVQKIQEPPVLER